MFRQILRRETPYTRKMFQMISKVVQIYSGITYMVKCNEELVYTNYTSLFFSMYLQNRFRGFSSLIRSTKQLQFNLTRNPNETVL